MADQLPESFEEAENRFSTFLKKNGHPGKVVWTDGSDVIWNGTELLVKETKDDWSRNAASAKYSIGVTKGLGICLEAFAVTTSSTVARVFVPVDDDERQRALIGKGLLKLSAFMEPFRARQVRNRVIWHVASARHRKFTERFVNSVFNF